MVHTGLDTAWDGAGLCEQRGGGDGGWGWEQNGDPGPAWACRAWVVDSRTAAAAATHVGFAA